MAVLKYFMDREGNEMKLYLNTEGEIFIETGDLSGEDAPYRSAWIVLTKDDAIELRKELDILISKMS